MREREGEIERERERERVESERCKDSKIIVNGETNTITIYITSTFDTIEQK